MKFGFYTDTHYTLRCEARTDDTLASFLAKTKEAFEFFVSSGCEFVIFGGDMFDRHRELNFELLRRVWEVYNSFPLPVYFIMGNHDENGYRWQTIDKSNIGFLASLMKERLIFIEDSLELPGCIIYAHHAGQDLNKRQSAIVKSDKPVILVSHCLLADNRNIGNIHINEITNRNIDLVLSGDLHDGYSMQINKSGITCYNSGSLGRVSRHDTDRKPKVAVFNFEYLMDSWTTCIREKELTIESGEMVFVNKAVGVPEVEKDIKDGTETYIHVFRKFKGESRDIFDALHRVGIETGIDAAVLSLIDSYKDRQNI